MDFECIFPAPQDVRGDLDDDDEDIESYDEPLSPAMRKLREYVYTSEANGASQPMMSLQRFFAMHRLRFLLL